MSIVAQRQSNRLAPTLLEKQLRDEFLIKSHSQSYELYSKCAIEVHVVADAFPYPASNPNGYQGFLNIYSTYSLDTQIQLLGDEHGITQNICNGLAVPLLISTWRAAACVLDREQVCKGSASEELWHVALLEQKSEEEMKVFYKKHFEGRAIGRFNPYKSGWIESHGDSAGGDNLFDCLAMNPCTRGSGKEFLLAVMKQCLTTGSWEDKQPCYKDGVLHSEDDVCIHYVGET